MIKYEIRTGVQKLKSKTQRTLSAISISIFSVGLMVAVPLSAHAAQSPKLDKQSTGPNQCAGGTLKVNVNYTLLNDADSGFGGNYWANDTMGRHLQIWQESDGNYCVSVNDHGSFVTYAGKSPSGASTVGAGVTGTIEGGYITTDVNGTFDPGSNPTKGNLGSYDLQCDQSGNCPGSAISWTHYFTSLNSYHSFAQWGWVYHAGQNGTWLNQDNVAAADSGDITGN